MTTRFETSPNDLVSDTMDLPWRRIFIFVAAPLAGVFAPLLLYPVVARVSGAEALVSLATGQSIGSFAALLAGVGFNLNGPSRAALLVGEKRAQFFLAAVLTRAMGVIVFGAIGGVAAWLIAPMEFKGLALVGAIAFTAAALTPTWFFAGTGDSRLVVALDAAPRMLTTVIAALLILAGWDPIVFPWLLLTSTGSIAAIYFILIARRANAGWLHEISWRAFAGRQLHEWAAEVVSGSYSTLAASLVSAGAVPIQAATYISSDRLFRIPQAIIGALGTVLQGWSGEIEAQGSRRRAALLIHASIGSLGGICYALLAPPISRILFGERIEVSGSVSVAFGIAILALSINTSLGRHYLVPSGRGQVVLIWLGVASLLGAPGLFLAAEFGGALGAACVLAAVETFVAVAFAISILVGRRTRSNHPLRRTTQEDEEANL